MEVIFYCKAVGFGSAIVSILRDEVPVLRCFKKQRVFACDVLAMLFLSFYTHIRYSIKHDRCVYPQLRIPTLPILHDQYLVK